VDRVELLPAFKFTGNRVELLPAFKFTGKMVKIKDFTGKW